MKDVNAGRGAVQALILAETEKQNRVERMGFYDAIPANRFFYPFADPKIVCSYEAWADARWAAYKAERKAAAEAARRKRQQPAQKKARRAKR